MVSHDFSRQLRGYGLTTAHIFYRRPDHPWLLQSYVWQEYDLCPHFPQLNRFLGFWREKLAGNRRRDALVTRTLRRAGWRVLRVWEHELAGKNQPRLARRLAAFTDTGRAATG